MRDLKPKGELPSTPIGLQKPGHTSGVKATKSRNGCQRCKARRLKCDEAKPKCKRCTEKGISCPGYARDFKWSSKYEVLRTPTDPPSSQSATTEPPPMPTPPFPEPSLNEFGHSGLDDFSTSVIDFSGEQRGELGMSQPMLRPKSELSDGLAEPLLDELGLQFHGFDQPLMQANTGSNPYFFDDVFASSNMLLPTFQAMDDSMLPATTQPSADQLLEAVGGDEEVIEEVDQNVGTSIVPASRRARNTSSSSAHTPEDLLRWYYRMTPTQYSDTDLVDHYFSQVCRLYALFDSTKNPFRALVGHNWDSSGSISLAIQSMSCAHLANSNPAMERIGLNKQRQARISIHNDLQLWRSGSISADRVLLAILLLGPTTSWHNASDIGLEHLNIARELINAKLSQQRQPSDEKARSLEQFFLHAMIYWEMMIAFVDSKDNVFSADPDALEASLQQLNLNTDGPPSTPPQEVVKPHPWTGIAPHVQMLFAEVGRIMRRRVNNAHGPLATESEQRWAAAVENALKAAEIPTSAFVLGSEDQNTPEDHLVQLAEAYRCAGLLQIYHVFPSVLTARLQDGDDENPITPTTESMDDYRIALAIHTLELVEALPISSGTSCLHPILVLTAGSELRYGTTSPLPGFLDQQTDQRIVVARDFAEQRLLDLANRLPKKPYLRMLDIMKETWLQMDMFGTPTHWMQVMYERGWETIMG
ncbi:uncharacterized protein HMPREF1541_05648 [Cyphellophora europaea CBS 101466]|uniref:Zn(2)-C6 fungal-type domain-containing protein n=1 Tax=Cyphellophora europaea (strain CBS 101466) TaxID=1220924 RepID=W2RSZ9_CYPE1|nr:uncharacterized protein HMPREF1541_05648 [Cyphellophora europaea CBS 101466]ETN39425.1 hypothetical protein HMPREF1541_05648 [Cyphellophora europaea CBS 101466]